MSESSPEALEHTQVGIVLSVLSPCSPTYAAHIGHAEKPETDRDSPAEARWPRVAGRRLWKLYVEWNAPDQPEPRVETAQGRDKTLQQPHGGKPRVPHPSARGRLQNPLRGCVNGPEWFCRWKFSWNKVNILGRVREAFLGWRWGVFMTQGGSIQG